MQSRRSFLGVLAAIIPAGMLGRCVVAGEADPVLVPIPGGDFPRIGDPYPYVERITRWPDGSATKEHVADVVISIRVDTSEARRQLKDFQARVGRKATRAEIEGVCKFLKYRFE